MKLKKRLCAYFCVFILATNNTNASGIPTVDAAAIMQTLQQYIGQINEYAETAIRYTESIQNWQQEMQNMAGLRELGTLMSSIEDIQNKVEKLKDKYQGLQDLASDPASLFDRNIDLKRLLDKLQVYDNCADIVDTEQKNICYYKFNSQLQELAGFKQDKEELQKTLNQIGDLNTKLKGSDNLKMTLDLLASAQKLMLDMEAQRRAQEIVNTEMQRQREIDEVRREQYYKKVMSTKYENPKLY